MLKRAQEAPLRPPHSSNASITITGSSSHGTSSRPDNGVSMRFLKRRSISDELCSLLCLTKCRRKEGYKRARSQATTRQRESVVIVVDCVRSNRSDITCLFWSCDWVEMLAAKADFPTPGDPLIQIIVWPLVFLTLVSIACRMSLWMPSIHDLRSLSFFTPRALTKSSSSFFSTTVFLIYDIKFSIHECWPWITDNLPWIFETPACTDLTSFAMVADTTNQKAWTMNIGTETTPCSTKISIWRSRSNLSAKASQLSHNSIAFERQRGCIWLGRQIPSQMNSYVRVQFSSHF